MEFGVDATWHVASNFDVEFGYNFIYLNDIATSTTSLGTVIINNNPNTGGVGFENALYHGGSIKAALRW